jgi:ABC-type cobalt transport system substrate-binding protein
MNIRDILLIIIIIYLILSHSKKNKNIENFALSVDDKNEVITLIKNEIRPALKEIYNTDMSAVRNLDKLAQDIQSGGYSIDITDANITIVDIHNINFVDSLSIGHFKNISDFTLHDCYFYNSVNLKIDGNL